MITFKDGNYIDETKLSKTEARWFIQFLLEERQRHVMIHNFSDYCRYLYRDIPVLKIAYSTATQRHLGDITHIDKTIDYCEKKHNIDKRGLFKNV